MNNQVADFLTQLQVLASSTGLEITKLEHEPMSGGYLGQVILEATKNNLAVRVMIDLDFLQENDGISLSVNLVKAYHGDFQKSLKEAINQMQHNFNIAYSDQLFNLLSREIKVRTELYN